MSKFNGFMKRLNETATARFEAYNEAAAAEKAAREKADSLKSIPFPKTPEDMRHNARVAEAKATHEEAKKALQDAIKAMQDARTDIAKIRAELITAIDEEYRIDAAKLDSRVLELMKSNILSAIDYRRLLDEAINADNVTMARMVAKFATDKAKELEATNIAPEDTRYKEYHQERETPNNVINEAKNYDGGDYIADFDTISRIYGRCVNNPAMIPAWENLTSEFIENF